MSKENQAIHKNAKKTTTKYLQNLPRRKKKDIYICWKISQIFFFFACLQTEDILWIMAT